MDNGYSDYLQFVQLLKDTLKDLPEPEPEPCPSSLILALYTSENLDPETTAHVGCHALYCDKCVQDILLLEKMQKTLSED